MSGGVFWITVIVGGVVIILVFDVFGRFITSLIVTCRLKRGIIIKDACVGKCPPGQQCVALTTRPYFGFGTQAATCGCVPVGAGGTPTTPPPGGVAGSGGAGTGSGGSGGGGSAADGD
ncbi:hypothetical protein [Pukyongiella litopenaei]|uniref:Uncharacterized protein n=1 Tax=Pukyongiella litopenaei TaxID=2605946 RepID=A0A2S0MSL1_9RHOB|nr:hypothetical protein [Pukyongiella litopenaei]AVO38879.1 hypothetical protein C6Y53_15010 [Pukyongiella litopenaei]